MALQCYRILRSERPDVILSTGGCGGRYLLSSGKSHGHENRIHSDFLLISDGLSLSGRMVIHFADLFLVQWPDLAERYEKARYVGSVI